MIYIKRNATESDKERKKERLESCHPDLVVPDRWPVRHEQLMCMIVCLQNKRARQQSLPPSLPVVVLLAPPRLFRSSINSIRRRRPVFALHPSRAKEKVRDEYQKEGHGENNP